LPITLLSDLPPLKNIIAAETWVFFLPSFLFISMFWVRGKILIILVLFISLGGTFNNKNIGKDAY
jgi:hypothetical protein